MDIFTYWYDDVLIYFPNIFFPVVFLLVVASGLLLVHIIYKAAKYFLWFSKRSLKVFKKRKKLRSFRVPNISIKDKLQFIVFFIKKSLKLLFHIINKKLEYIENRGNKVIRRIKKEIFISSIIIFLFTFVATVQADEYSLAWPGILPDHPLYKLKVLRNKVIYRLIIHPIKKVEFDLLMADKTIYAGKLLVDKGKVALAKDTVLKGENYYSMLVQDYNKAILRGETISPVLDKRITLAALKHQEIFKDLEDKVGDTDKETFQTVFKFSTINYEFISGLRKNEEK